MNDSVSSFYSLRRSFDNFRRYKNARDASRGRVLDCAARNDRIIESAFPLTFTQPRGWFFLLFRDLCALVDGNPTNRQRVITRTSEFDFIGCSRPGENACSRSAAGYVPLSFFSFRYFLPPVYFGLALQPKSRGLPVPIKAKNGEEPSRSSVTKGSIVGPTGRSVHSTVDSRLKDIAYSCSPCQQDGRRQKETCTGRLEINVR